MYVWVHAVFFFNDRFACMFDSADFCICTLLLLFRVAAMGVFFNTWRCAAEETPKYFLDEEQWFWWWDGEWWVWSEGQMNRVIGGAGL